MILYVWWAFAIIVILLSVIVIISAITSRMDIRSQRLKELEKKVEVLEGREKR